MTTSQIPVPVPVAAAVRRRRNRRVAFALIKHRVDRLVTDFVWTHQLVVTLIATLAAGLIIAVAARVLLTISGL